MRNETGDNKSENKKNKFQTKKKKKKNRIYEKAVGIRQQIKRETVATKIQIDNLGKQIQET